MHSASDGGGVDWWYFPGTNQNISKYRSKIFQDDPTNERSAVVRRQLKLLAFPSILS